MTSVFRNGYFLEFPSILTVFFPSYISLKKLSGFSTVLQMEDEEIIPSAAVNPGFNSGNETMFNFSNCGVVLLDGEAAYFTSGW